MLTVLESINLSTEYLEQKGIESARTNAELLLADILECKRLDLYLKFDRPLNEKEKEKYRDYIARRGKFEPLQYILGSVEFYGEEFEVNKNVLIPRQETEILIETTINLLKGKENLNLLDIGTGTGIIPILMAKNLNCEVVKGIDISEEAIKTAKRNAENHELSDTINFVKFDIFDLEKFKAGSKYDVVISNPPYVSNDEYNSLQKEITEFEPGIAVTDFEDGYKFYKYIVEKSDLLLKTGGFLIFELGIGQSETVKSFLETNGFLNIKIVKDYLDINRVIYGEKQ